MIAKARAEAKQAAATAAAPRTEEEQAELDDRLSKAAWFGELEEAERLLGAGADPEARQQDIFGATPLIRAAKAGHTTIMILLLSNGATVSCRDNSGWLASHWAASFGKVEALGVLTEHGADLTKRTTEGWTPHDVAAMKGKAAVVEYLESLPSASTATPSRAAAAAAAVTGRDDPKKGAQRALGF